MPNNSATESMTNDDRYCDIINQNHISGIFFPTNYMNTSHSSIPIFISCVVSHTVRFEYEEQKTSKYLITL